MNRSLRLSLYHFFMGIIAVLALGACASEPKTIGFEDYDDNSKAHGAAYRADAMHTRRPMPSHSDWKPLPFYFKHCTEIGEASFYSKTSYICTEL